jgi:hypothetical protein
MHSNAFVTDYLRCVSEVLQLMYNLRSSRWITMKNAVLWDVKLCGSCRNRHFRGTYHFHHQGDKLGTLAVTSKKITLRKNAITK